MHHYAWLPRSSGIQCLQKHEFNPLWAAERVLYIYAFYCLTSRTRNVSFPQGGSQSGHPIKESQRSMLWSALGVICTAVSRWGRGDFTLSHQLCCWLFHIIFWTLLDCVCICISEWQPDFCSMMLPYIISLHHSNLSNSTSCLISSIYTVHNWITLIQLELKVMNIKSHTHTQPKAM